MAAVLHLRTPLNDVVAAGEFIGGGDDTESLDRSGKLAEMLKQKGIL
jgi:hypothetical protein